MENMLTVASYVYDRYRDENGQRIDEMKLHKLMYFAQREALIQTGEPLFDATFYGWKYGPVLKEIRAAYKEDSFAAEVPQDVMLRLRPIMDRVFDDYAGKDSWSLSRLTHGELCWKRSREGLDRDGSGNNPIALEDMRQDAARIKDRREMLDRLGLL